jgi:ABC-type Co2+ transport system permease subunit
VAGTVAAIFISSRPSWFEGAQFPQGAKMKKFRWTDWAVAAALVFALSAFAGAETLDDPQVASQLR